MIEHVKKFVSYSLGTWVAGVISFLSVPLLTYLIVPEEFGKASMFTLIYNIVYLVSLLGLDESYMRYYNVPEIKREQLFWDCLVPSATISLLFSFPLILFSRYISFLVLNTSNRYIAFLLSVSVITGVVQRYNQLSIRMQKKGFAYSLLEITSKASNVLATLSLAIFVTRSFYAVVWGQIIGNLSALILGFAIDKQNRRFHLPSIKRINEYLKYGLPMVPSALLYWAFSSVDRVVLRRFSTFSEIGLYSAAFKVNTIFSIFTTGFLAYWKPLAFEKNEKERNKQFFKQATSLVSFIMFFIGMLTLIFKDVIVLIMEKSYRNVTYIMPFLILIPIMTIISETTVMGIYFQKKTYWHIAIASISVVLNYLGNLVLIPSLGARGAAISTGLSYVAFMVLRTYISKRIYPVEYEFGKLISGTLVTIVVAFVCTFSYYLAGFLASLIGIGVLVFIYGNEFRLVVSVLKDVKNRFAGNKVKK